MELKDLRTEIDKIDDELVRLFGARMEIAAQIADYKKEHNLPILILNINNYFTPLINMLNKAF